MLKVNDKVLCYHGPFLYEATVLETENKTGKGGEGVGPHYKVHYKGWKRTWDEWVPEDRVLPPTEENYAQQQKLRELANPIPTAAPKKKGLVPDGKKGTGATGPDSAPKGVKRSRDHDIEKQSDFLSRPEIKLTIPDTLKSILVDDWENVTKHQQLVPLPRKPNVVGILKAYSAAEKSARPKRPGSAEADIFEEVVSGIKVYFDRCLGNILLYRFERQQYVDIRRTNEGKEMEMSEIYGAEHLLRLFVSLPGLIAHTSMDQQSIQTLKDHIEGILKYMARNRDDLFEKNYEATSAQYQREPL